MDHTRRHANPEGVQTVHRRQQPRHQLELRVDAEPFWMSGIRALTTDLAIRADFDLDSVADLTLAVDEACAMLIDVAEAGDTLACRFSVTVDEIMVTATLPVGRRVDRPSLATNTFGWRVMVTLADDVDLIDSSEDVGRDAALAIRLTKRRGPAGG
ncbi:MAG TPA: ATP-binding protein [Pseudonocardiaceae bacterium]